MRELGYRVIDRIVDHVDGLPNRPVAKKLGRRELDERLSEPVPEQPMDPDRLFEQLDRDVLGPTMHVDHPRYFAFVPGPSNFVGVLADALASGLNVFAGTWLEASGPAAVELTTIDWLRELIGYPESAGGLFVSGGSIANLTALTVARQEKLGEAAGDGVVYCSRQTHASLERALRVLGFPRERMRRLATDDGYRLRVDVLEEAIAEDRRAGRRPACVIANAGTTNTGAVDPLPAIAELCERHDLWFHIDGAYGAASVLSERGRKLLEGIERADSVSLDPHKWLFQPYEAGCVLVRQRELLEKTFRVQPEYMGDAESATDEVNFCDYGLQLTRSFRALKLWMSIKLFGLDAFRKAVEHGLDLAEQAEIWLQQSPGFEVLTPAQLGIVSYRYRPRGLADDEPALNRLNAEIVRELIEDGFAMVSSTLLEGTRALRLCTINPRTTEDDVRQTVQLIETIGSRLSS